jgi:TolB protein
MSIRSLVLPAVLVAALLSACVAALLVASAEEAGAAFPGKNGRIALCADFSVIYSVLPDGSGYRQEVFGTGEYACEQAYSPDGTKLAYVSLQSGEFEIYVKDLASGQVDRLTDNSVEPDDPNPVFRQDRNPAWSPDGAQIVFERWGDFDGAGLWVMDADGSDQRPLSDAGVVGFNPAWSPGGAQIAFGRDDDIWVMDADGSDQRNLTSTQGAVEGAPSWSPDGAKIAFERDADVWKMRADGSGKMRLTSFLGRDDSPVWSPNGRKIAFIRAEGDLDVWKMNARDGSKKTNVTDNDFDEGLPDWQPKPTP